MKRSRPSRWRMVILFTAFLACALILGLLLYRKYETGRRTPSVPPSAQEGGTVFVTLFFADPEGEGLRREVREIDACGEPAACIESVVEELANGPVGDLEPTLPTTFSLRDVSVVNDLAVVDLEKGSDEGLPEGSSAEMTAIYSIVDSIAFNFPRIKSVKFMVGGEVEPTLKGHVDLRAPFSADFSMVKDGPQQDRNGGSK